MLRSGVARSAAERPTLCSADLIGIHGGTMIILGLILLLLGFFLKIQLLWILGVILLIVGVVLIILGSTGRAVGGRKHYY